MKSADAATRRRLLQSGSAYLRVEEVAAENDIHAAEIPALVRHFVRHLHPVFVMNGIYEALYHREAVNLVLANKPWK